MSGQQVGQLSPAVHSDIQGLVKDLTSWCARLQLPRENFSSSAQYQQFADMLCFRRTYLESEVWSKFSDEQTTRPRIRRERAIKKWLATEERNSRTNFRILTDRTFFGRSRLSSTQILNCASRFVSKVIGNDLPNTLVGDFTNGASTSQRRQPGSMARKYTQQVHVTEDSFPYVLPILIDNATGWIIPYLRENSPKTVQGNVLFTQTTDKVFTWC